MASQLHFRSREENKIQTRTQIRTMNTHLDSLRILFGFSNEQFGSLFGIGLHSLRHSLMPTRYDQRLDVVLTSLELFQIDPDFLLTNAPSEDNRFRAAYRLATALAAATPAVYDRIDDLVQSSTCSLSLDERKDILEDLLVLRRNKDYFATDFTKNFDTALRSAQETCARQISELAISYSDYCTAYQVTKTDCARFMDVEYSAWMRSLNGVPDSSFAFVLKFLYLFDLSWEELINRPKRVIPKALLETDQAVYHLAGCLEKTDVEFLSALHETLIPFSAATAGIFPVHAKQVAMKAFSALCR